MWKANYRAQSINCYNVHWSAGWCAGKNKVSGDTINSHITQPLFDVFSCNTSAKEETFKPSSPIIRIPCVIAPDKLLAKGKLPNNLQTGPFIIILHLDRESPSVVQTQSSRVLGAHLKSKMQGLKSLWNAHLHGYRPWNLLFSSLNTCTFPCEIWWLFMEQ